jgi:hypothetical protein
MSRRLRRCYIARNSGCAGGAARGARFSVPVGLLRQDLFFSGEGSYFDERAMQYGVADLIQVIRKAPASLTE